MNWAYIPNHFAFLRIHFEKYHYTNQMSGSPMNYIAYMLKGTGKIISGSGSIDMKEGDVFFIPINLPYQSYWYGNDKIEFLSIGFADIEAKEKLN